MNDGTLEQPGAIAIYHQVYARETFGDGAEALFTMIRDAARKHPGTERHLYLDIDGHRNPAGSERYWDRDADALLAWFVPEVLSQWLTRYSGTDGNEVTNPSPSDDVPDGMYLITKDGDGPRVVGLGDDRTGIAGKKVISVQVRTGARLGTAGKSPDYYQAGDGQ
jgi:hypothetical protein